jgi:hypothetical protein
MKTAFLEELKHRRVLRQNLRYKLTNPCVFRDRGKVSKQHPANTSALIRVGDHEGDLRLFVPDKHIATTAYDRWSGAIIDDCDQRNVFLEIDIDEETGLLLGEDRPHREKAAVKRECAGPIDGGFKSWPIGWLQGSYFDTAAIPQHLDR